MSYSNINVSLTPGQLKKLQSKSAKQCGTTITLKPNQMNGGANKLPLTTRQVKHFNDAFKDKKGVQITLSAAAIKNMIKTGGIFPLFAALPALVAAAAPAVAKAAALGVVGGLGTKAVQSIAESYEPKKGRGYKKKGKGLRLPGTPYSWYSGKGLRLGPVY
jgi:hypothetical protein